MQAHSDIEIYLSIDRDGADLGERDALATRLIGDLKQVEGVLDIERVAPQQDDSGRSKSAGEIATWGQLALTLVASHGVLTTLIAAIKAWMTRQPPTTLVKLKIGKEELEVKGTDPNTVERLVRALLERIGQLKGG
jgi:hypothetical protein